MDFFSVLRAKSEWGTLYGRIIKNKGVDSRQISMQKHSNCGTIVPNPHAVVRRLYV